MTLPVWPIDLPARPMLRQWQKVPQDNRLRFAPEAGPAIMRRLGTAAGKKWTATFVMTRDQLAAFEDFYSETLGDGTLPFEMRNPQTGETSTWTFDEGLYQVQEITNRRFSVAVNLLEQA